MVIIIISLRAGIITGENTLYNQTSGRLYGKKTGKFTEKDASVKSSLTLCYERVRAVLEVNIDFWRFRQKNAKGRADSGYL